MELCFRKVGIELDFVGQGLDGKGIEIKTGRELIIVEPRYFRPTGVDLLAGNPTKTKFILCWETETKLEELVKIMIQAVMKLLHE